MAVIGANLALPYLIRLAIDNYIVNSEITTASRMTGLFKLAFIFLFVTGVGFFANFFQVTILEWTGQHFMHDMRRHLFRSLLDQDLDFFNKNPSGKLVTRLTNDIQNMHEMFTSVIITLFNDFLQLGGILVILFALNYKLALLMTLFLPLIIIISYFFSILARGAFRSIRTGIAKLNSFLHESVTGLEILQICLREEDTARRFTAQNHSYYEKTLYQIKIFGIFMPLIEVLGTVSISIIIYYGGTLVLPGHMTLGVFTAFLFYMRLFFKPVRELSQKYSIVQSAMASAERIFELLDRKSSLRHSENPGTIENCLGRIQFHNVTFGYERDEPVIKNLSLTIRQGEAIAIVGATGSGKSTLINLLERLYDPEHGSITLDNRNIKELETEWLRNQIGLVLQDVIILPGSIRENIAFGLEISDELFTEVIYKAQLNKVISELPDGMNTIIGEGGFELSAGQKQLLSLARVLVRDPKILILDEATASIDSATEILVEQAVKKTVEGRTSIIIAHRLSTIRNAERIIVMDEGKIIEEGSHQSLLEQKGLYHHLISLQVDDEQK
jgi:ATP-binding cassette subfamily B protein